MAAAAALVLLVATLARRRDAIALGFSLLVLTFGLWSYGRGGAAPGLPLAREMETLSLCVLGPAALLFAAQLVGRIDRWRRSAPALLLAATALSLATLLRGPETPVWLRLELVWAALGVAGGSLLLWRDRRPSDESESPDATRLRYLALCGAALPVCFAIDLLAWLAGGPRIATPLAALVFLYASYLHLVRVRLVDLRQLTTGAAALVLLASGMAGLFGGLALWVGGRLDLFLFDAFFVSVVVLIALPHARESLQRSIERRLVRSKVELERALEPLGDRLAHLVTLDDLLHEFLATLERTDRVTASSVYLRDDPRVGFQPAASIGMSPGPRVNLIRDPVFVAALEAGEILLDADLEPVRGSATGQMDPDRAATLRRVLHQLDAQLVLPLRTQDQLVGFWMLTDTSSDEGFSAAEIALLRDLASRLAAGVESSKTFEQIRARDRFASLGEMAAGLAHEIRNPLASIRGALAVLPTPEAPDLRELHEVILEETARLDRVVGTFLDYTQPQLGTARVDDVGRFVRECVQAIARRAGPDRIRLEVDASPDLPPVAAGADQLETVLVNVVRNAYEALSEGSDADADVGDAGGGGTIRVFVSPVPGVDGHPEGVELRVEDDGPGMDAETRERALVPFFTTRDRGTGLGLPLCERLVRELGGSLELAAEPGHGTRVTIRIPASSDPEREVA